MSEDRTIDLSVEVAGTPEEVWAAVATGPGISAWLHHTEIEEKPGGRYAYDMGLGDGLNDTGHVAAYEAPRRYATGGVVWTLPSGDSAELATEWTVQARDGGTCVVRLVMSGFGTGADWDTELDGMTSGMRAALDSLRRHLAGSGPTRILAAVAVADRPAAMPFYTALFGRPADSVPMPADAEWAVGCTTLQVVELPDRAGRSILTLGTDDLAGWVERLRGQGLPVSEVDDTTAGTLLLATVEDPDGNRITLVQAR